MNTYKLLQEYNVIIKTDAKGLISSIPYDLANSDYQTYLAWVAEGNVAEEYQPE
jgi:hypothetical protein